MTLRCSMKVARSDGARLYIQLLVLWVKLAVALTDGTMHKRDKVLLVPQHTVEATTEKNVIKVATKQQKEKLYFKREDLNKENIIEGKRTRKNLNIY